MKKINKLIFVFSILLLAILILFKSLNNIDELYNYNFGRNVASGNLIYKDFNVIVFPIFPLMMGALVKLLGQEVILFRIVQVIAFIATEMLIYGILKKLNKENHIFIQFLCVIYLCFIVIFCTLEYNLLTAILLLVILNLELKENKGIKEEMGIGLLLRSMSWSKTNSWNIDDSLFYSSSISFSR